MENNCELMIELANDERYLDLMKQPKGEWINLDTFYSIIGSSSPFATKHGFKLMECIEDGERKFVKLEVSINDEFDAEKLGLFLVGIDDVKNHWMVLYDFEGWGWMIGGDKNNKACDYFDDVESGEEAYLDWAANLPSCHDLGVFSENFFD